MSIDLYEKIPKITEVFVITNTVGNEALISFISTLSKMNRYSMLGKNGVSELERIIQSHKQDLVFEILDNFVSAMTICGVDVDVLEIFINNHNKLFKHEYQRLVEQTIPSSDLNCYYYVFYIISICIPHILDNINKFNIKN